MKKTISIILFFFFPLILKCYCQSEIEGEILEQAGEILNETENEALAREETEELFDILKERININYVDRETLQKLPFITEFQIYSFLEYRNKYGWIYSKNELWLIPGFHEDLIRKFIFLFDFSNTQQEERKTGSFKPSLRHRLLVRIKFENPDRKGFNDSLKSDRFNGGRPYRLVKYEMKKKERFRLGFSLENDPGESFSFDTSNKGFDFNSGFIEYYPRQLSGKFIIGDFRISSAEGLIYSFGRNGKSGMNAFRRKLPILKKYSSSSESGFYRGAAIHLKSNKIRSILYYSLNHNDAKTYNDSLNRNYFLSINNSGYHRNAREKLNRDKIREQTAGVILSYTTDHFQAGYNLKQLNYRPGMGITEKGDPYSKLKFKRNFFWQSLFYNFQLRKILISGELAKMHDGGYAFQQKTSISLHPLYSLNFGYRNFSHQYFCPGAGGLSESSEPGNEKGFFSEILSYPFSFLKVRLYLDHFYFPWISHSISFPSSGTDMLIDTEWYLMKDVDLRIYFKTEKKEFSSTPAYGMKKMTTGRTDRFYTRVTYSLNERFSFRIRFELKNRKENFKRPVHGILFYEELTGKLFDNRFSFNFRYTLFDVPDWEVRIYSWEHDLLYSFNSPSYYKNGQNVFLNLRWKINRHISSGLKLSSTSYSSIRESGTGSDYRKSISFHNLKAQLIIKL